MRPRRSSRPDGRDVLEEPADLALCIRNERPQFFDVGEGKTEETAAVMRVAAAERDGRLLQDENAGRALLTCRHGGRERGVAGADDDDIVLGHGRTLPRGRASLGGGRCRTISPCRAASSPLP